MLQRCGKSTQRRYVGSDKPANRTGYKLSGKGALIRFHIIFPSLEKSPGILKIFLISKEFTV
jgi:hypothetical protein